MQDVVDVLAVVEDAEHLWPVTLAAALLADQLDVGEELHLDGDGAVALAGLAASARDVERKRAGHEPFLASLGREGEQAADLVERLDVSDGIRTRRAADG